LYWFFYFPDSILNSNQSIINIEKKEMKTVLLVTILFLFVSSQYNYYENHSVITLNFENENQIENFNKVFEKNPVDVWTFDVYFKI
jgi:type II secretory pathway component PulC